MANERLADHPALALHSRKLRALGYKTVDQVAAAARVAGRAMTAFLGADISGALPPAPPPGPMGVAPQETAFPLGVALDRIPAPMMAFALSMPPAAAGLPAATSLVANMPAIRDQGETRGTCVAFASLAALENLRMSQGQFRDMSEEFLYWDCKANDGAPQTYGTWIGVAMPLLQRDGCCLESTWPYDPTTIDGNHGHNPPPDSALAEAPTMKIATFQQLPPTSIADIKSELVRGRAVAFSIPVFGWYDNTDVRLSGDIVLPFPGEAVQGGHAMCICGYQDSADDDAVGGGRFIIRNSWGTRWATSSAQGAGYGTIPYSYISSFGTEAYSIE